MVMNELGSSLAGLMFIWAMFNQYFPFDLQEHIEKYFRKFTSLFNPFVEITFHEFAANEFERSKAYTCIERYLGHNLTTRANRLRGDMVRDSESLILSMDDYEEIAEEYKGVKVWWLSNKNLPKAQTISLYPSEDEKRFYKLTFHRKDRDLVTKYYLDHVMKEGADIAVKTRMRRLYTNNGEESGHQRRLWSDIVFEHPASFDTLAMEPKKKMDIIDDLVTFSKSKEYYAKIGKAWKRGYLLYGPPGTGKSTMIAAIANFLEYDIYDLELAAVEDNTELRKLLIDTTSKSIIVIEDIDCSLDLTGQRKNEDNTKEKKKQGNDAKAVIEKLKEEMDEKDDSKSKVTLSGLLNFIDGLWSAIGSERIIIFTTNYVEKLDPALIRRGRMDKHIELSFCCFEAFKVLAKNYLDLESHDLFERVSELLGETKMTPADVAENLMPKRLTDDAKTRLVNLIEALEELKKQERLRAEEEEKTKAKEKEEEQEADTDTKTKAKEKEEEQREADTYTKTTKTKARLFFRWPWSRETKVKSDEEKKNSSKIMKENGVPEDH